jgi:hypothetical protein
MRTSVYCVPNAWTAFQLVDPQVSGSASVAVGSFGSDPPHARHLRPQRTTLEKTARRGRF